MDINLYFDDKDWLRIEHDWSAWWAQDIDRPMVTIETTERAADADLSQRAYSTTPDFTAHFPLSVPAEEIIDHCQYQLEVSRFHGDSWPKWWPNFGPGIVAGFLGAKVRVRPETVWFEPAEQRDITHIRLEYEPDNVWLKRVIELSKTAVERWGQKVCVGHTDLGGNLDILASFRSAEQLLMELYDNPEQVSRCAGQITKLWIRYYDEIYNIVKKCDRGTTPWAAIWSPGRCYMLQCDFSYMISPQMFERFVLPDIAACCEHLDHSFYHLDGKGQIPHLDMLLSLEHLDGIQWIPGEGAEPAEQWLELLKRIRDAGKLCQAYVTPEGAITIKRELGGKGFAFNILHDGMRAEQAVDLVKLLCN